MTGVEVVGLIAAVEPLAEELAKYIAAQVEAVKNGTPEQAALAAERLASLASHARGLRSREQADHDAAVRGE